MEQMGAFLPLILIFGVFYILLIRPQQKKVKKHREMINNLRRGDKIITSGGLIGLITKVNENKELQVEITNDVEIRLAPGMVTDLYLNPEIKKTTSKNDAKSSTLKEPTSQKKGLLSGIFNIKKN